MVWKDERNKKKMKEVLEEKNWQNVSALGKVM